MFVALRVHARTGRLDGARWTAASPSTSPIRWKGYTIGDPLSPSTKNTAWRLDDEKLVYPCVREGSEVRHHRTSASTRACCRATTRNPGPACGSTRPWTMCPRPRRTGRRFNFIMYHGALRPFLEDPAYELDLFEKTGEIRWVTDLAKIPEKYGVNNVYGELGTTFATCAVANPRFAAAWSGSFVNGWGRINVVWGTDSVWYGSPQWQIEAMRRLEIPDDMMKKQGWKIQARRRRQRRQAQDLRRELRAPVQLQDRGGATSSSGQRQAGADEGGVRAGTASSATTRSTATSARRPR